VSDVDSTPGTVQGAGRDAGRGGVYEWLYHDIVAGDMAPGTALVELHLAQRYGVSRTPVREALRRLEHDGLVERHNRGLRVRTSSPEQVLEIYEVRVALEGIAARSAAENRSTYDLARLRATTEDMRALDGTDPPAMAAANLRFHEAMWAAGRNATLVELLERLQAHVARYPETTLSHPGRWQAAIAEHDAIVDAIAERDQPRAKHLAEAHMTAARDIRLQHAAASV
jgi:DNA-binding GntR family transcriptional regulator